MDKRKSSNAAPAASAPAPSQAAMRKLARERLAPELDRYMLRLGLAGLLDGGANR